MVKSLVRNDPLMYDDQERKAVYRAIGYLPKAAAYLPWVYGAKSLILWCPEGDLNPHSLAARGF
jgi:hypothetical protein